MSSSLSDCAAPALLFDLGLALGASLVFPGSDSWFVEERKPGNPTLKARHQIDLYVTHSFCHCFKHLLNVCAKCWRWTERPAPVSQKLII